MTIRLGLLLLLLPETKARSYGSGERRQDEIWETRGGCDGVGEGFGGMRDEIIVRCLGWRPRGAATSARG